FSNIVVMVPPDAHVPVLVVMVMMAVDVRVVAVMPVVPGHIVSVMLAVVGAHHELVVCGRARAGLGGGTEARGQQGEGGDRRKKKPADYFRGNSRRGGAAGWVTPFFVSRGPPHGGGVRPRWGGDCRRDGGRDFFSARVPPPRLGRRCEDEVPPRGGIPPP